MNQILKRTISPIVPVLLGAALGMAVHARGEPAPAAGKALAELETRWDKVSRESTGPERLAALRGLCKEAVDKLGAGEEMALFATFISSHGEKDLKEWLLVDGMRPLFSGPRAAEARTQMLTVKDDAIRNSLCHRAGEGYGALGFKEYLDSFTGTPDAACQSPLLAGRCMALAKTDLAAAIYAFRELKTGGINHYCLGEALAEALKDADYPTAKKALDSLPEELRGEALTGLQGKQGTNVGPYLAALDEIIHTTDWPKNQPPLCAKLHNLVIRSTDYDTLLAWAALLPEREDTADLHRVAVRGFVTYQHERSKKWIESLPPGWKKQNALASFMQTSLMTLNDMEGAKWARGQITDPNRVLDADGWIIEFEKRFNKTYPR